MVRSFDICEAMIYRKTAAFVLMLMLTVPLTGQDINFHTGVFSTIYTDEQWPGRNPRHQGYHFGFDVVIDDGNYFLMPGMYFLKTSLFPVDLDFGKPYFEYPDIKSIKLPFQVGSYVYKNRFADLKLHGGIAANFLLGIDENPQLVVEDFNEIHAGLVAGMSFRALFMTARLSYEHGLSRIYKEKAPSGIDDKSKSNVLSLMLGVHF